MFDIGARCCEVQQRIYEFAANKGYNIESFSNAYLQSSFCKRAFDTIYSRFMSADVEESADFFIPEIASNLTKEKNDYNSYAGEIGYIYRALFVRTSIPSEELFKKVPFSAVAKKAVVSNHYGYDECVNELMNEYHLKTAPFLFE